MGDRPCRIHNWSWQRGRAGQARPSTGQGSPASARPGHARARQGPDRRRPDQSRPAPAGQTRRERTGQDQTQPA
eukprot:7939392-Alexandrium_andersonii.AAC.1